MLKIIAILTLSYSVLNFAQFDELIFSKHFTEWETSLLWHSVLGLGDQNNDGYDDILIYECNGQKAKIYFGGSPMDTIPDLEISIWMLGAEAVDVNHNGFNDIVINHNIPPSGRWVSIYYGGPLLDTIPDVVFERPPGTSQSFGNWINVLEDFDGDSYPEIVIGDVYLPYSSLQLGALYFYKTYPQLDIIPFAVITGDSVTDHEAFGITSSGDINGDGLTDFNLFKSPHSGGYYRNEFYLGDTEWNLAPAVIYKEEEHIFDLSRMFIIEDINKDGKDDILTDDYDGTYPWWYHLAIWHGSFPIDTIPDVGINGQASTLVHSELICTPGDVNGDTFNDLMLGIGGGGGIATRLWLGSRNMPNDPIQSWGGTGTFQTYALLAKIGDVDGDGVNDVCVGLAHASCEGYNTDFIYIFKGDTSVKIDTGTVGIIYEPELPEKYYLLEAYPNPFNPSTTIKYRIPGLSFVTVKVFDVLGREIAMLVNKEQPAGEYEIIFDASKYKLSSGVYFYQLRAERFVVTKKMILLR